MSDTLLPCPFCGETPRVNKGATTTISCNNARCYVHVETLEFGTYEQAVGFAIEAWNKRVGVPRVP